MSPRRISLFLLLAFAADLTSAAHAQPYCAMYSDGARDCGIPTLQGCRQSIRGVGGTCVRDTTSQRPPNFIQLFPPLAPPPSGRGRPQDNPNWMPPPPGM